MSRILIVDDAAFMRMMLKNIVSSSGHEVVGEAVDFIQRYLFAVKRADYGSAARRAEIYRKNSLFTH